MGFSECVTEISHYLSSVEGVDPSDPLSSRLLCHLTSRASQRDSALKAAVHQQAQLLHPWVTGPCFLPYRQSGLMVPSDIGGAPQRLGEVLASSPSSFMLSCPSFSTPLLSFPVALHQRLPLWSSSSSLSPHSNRPWGSEVGAF